MKRTKSKTLRDSSASGKSLTRMTRVKKSDKATPTVDRMQLDKSQSSTHMSKRKVKLMDSIEQPSELDTLKHSRKKSRSKSIDKSAKRSTDELGKSHKRSTSKKRENKEKLTMLEKQERVKQMDLRKQIAVKERQLKKMTQQAEKLRIKIGAKKSATAHGESIGDYGEESKYMAPIGYQRNLNTIDDNLGGMDVVNIQTLSPTNYEDNSGAPLRRSSREAPKGIKRKTSKGSTERPRGSQDVIPVSSKSIFNRKKNSSKSPSSGGALRSQQFNSRRPTPAVQTGHASQQSPLRYKNPITIEDNQDLNTIQPTFGPTPKDRERSRASPTDLFPTRGPNPNEMNVRYSSKASQPLRGKNSPQRNNLSITHNSVEESINRNRERVNMLRMDNDSTKRRLDLVERELSRVRQERTVAQRQQSSVQMDINRMEVSLSGDSKHAAQHATRITQDQIQHEKNQNNKLQNDIIRVQQDTDKIKVKIQTSKSEKNALEHDVQQNQYNKNIKDKEIGVFEQQRIQTMNKLGDYEAEVSQLNQSQNILQLEKERLDLQVQKLQIERDSLYAQVQQKQSDMDYGERTLIRDQQNLNEENHEEEQLVTAKLLGTLLDQFICSRKSVAFNEIEKYARFDQICQQRLKTFSTILNRLAVFKMRESLNQWYNNALMPFGTMKQNYNIASIVPATNKKLQIFNVLRRMQQLRQINNLSKSDGIQIIKERLAIIAKAEAKRALMIWKFKFIHARNQSWKVNKLVQRRHKIDLRQAFYIWWNNQNELFNLCRMHLMKQDFTNKVHLTQVFHALKRATTDQKKLKKLMLGNVMKAWQNYVMRKRYMTQQNLATLAFMQKNNDYMKEVCFNALRQNKEENAHQLMQYALKQDMDVSLQKSQAQMQDIDNMTRHKIVSRGIQTFDLHFKKYLASYWNQWLKHQQYKKVSVNQRLRDRIYAIYRGKLEHGFQAFKTRASLAHQKKKQMVIQEINFETNGKEQEFFQDKNQIRETHMAVCSVAQNKTSKIVKKLLMRQMKERLYDWKNRVDHIGHTKDKQNSIIYKLKKRLMRQAWESFSEKVRYCQQHDRNVVSADHLMETFRMKRLRKMFDGFEAFVNDHRRARKYWGSILSRMDLTMKSKALGTWRDNMGVKAEVLFSFDQNNQVQHIEAKSRVLKDSDHTLDVKAKELMNREEEALNQCRKVIGNHIKRYSTHWIQYFFRQWKSRANKLTQRIKIIEKFNAHWRKYKFQVLAHVFKNWAHSQKITQRHARKKQVLIEQEEQVLSINHNQEMIEEKRVKTEQKCKEVRASHNFYQNRKDKATDMVTQKNLDKYFVSRKRLLFCSWRHAVIQEKAFVLCVKNVLEKSMFMKGFVGIQEGSRDVKKENSQYKLCNKFMNFFKQNNLQDCFMRWKHYNQSKVRAITNAIFEEKEVFEQNAAEKKALIKDQNCENVHTFFRRRRLKKIIDAWYLHDWTKEQDDIKKQRGAENMRGVKWKLALQKWHQRTELTKRIRRNFAFFKQQRIFNHKVKVFRALIDRRNYCYDLSKNLSTLERLLRTKMYGDSFKCIKSYQVSKNRTEKRNRIRSIQDFESFMNQWHIKNSKKWFERLKLNAKTKNYANKDARAILKRVLCWDTRDAFKRWARCMLHQKFCKEMNETGPVTEFVFEAKRTIYNLGEFMKQEHYTPDEIINAKQSAHNENMRLIRLLVNRMKIPKENRVIMRCMNHWKWFIWIKRGFKYYLNKGNNAVEFGRADMSWAFGKWKNNDAEVAGVLRRNTFANLCAININQSKKLHNQANIEGGQTAAISHLNLQRDELLDHFMRSQKLALSAANNSYLINLAQAFTHWRKYKNHCIRVDQNQMIMQGVERITQLKQDQKELEVENEKLADENDELRRFSLEGYTIAKSVKKLTEEREKLSVDLADKADQIKELLERNRLLKEQLGALGYRADEYVGRKKGITIERSRSKELRGGGRA